MNIFLWVILEKLKSANYLYKLNKIQLRFPPTIPKIFVIHCFQIIQICQKLKIVLDFSNNPSKQPTLLDVQPRLQNLAYYSTYWNV